MHEFMVLEKRGTLLFAYFTVSIFWNPRKKSHVKFKGLGPFDYLLVFKSLGRWRGRIGGGGGEGVDRGNVSPAKHATSQLHHDNKCTLLSHLFLAEWKVTPNNVNVMAFCNPPTRSF